MIIPTFLSHKSVAVLGLGKDGASAVKSLYAADADIYAWDDNEASRAALHQANWSDEIESAGCITVKQPELFPWKEIALLVLSPGIPFTHPVPHPIVLLAQKHHVPIICALELLYQTCRESRYIGITGTNGKSTTTALIGHILKEAGQVVEVGGNIGIPAMDLRPLDQHGTYVLEMSSYQLDLLDKFTPDISVLLNITPDHLDRHGGMEGYIAAKCRIFAHQGKGHSAVIGVDNPESQKIYRQLQEEGNIGRVIGISAKTPQENGVAVIDGMVHIALGGQHKQLSLGALPHLAGAHNAENIATAIAVALLSGVPVGGIVGAVKCFDGLPHRMQYVTEIDGVRFINDSKATNAEAAEKALGTYEDIFWIAGGVPKEGGIAPLAPLFPRISQAFLIGQCEKDFAKTLEGQVDYTLCGTLHEATEQAAHAAFLYKEKYPERHPVVLLSPACASFDQWPNFEARGDAFIRQVQGL